MVRKVKARNGGTIHLLEKGETANPNGRPRKLFGTVNNELKAKGSKVLTKSQYIEALGLIYNSEEEELKEIAKDNKYPWGLRLMIQELENDNTKSQALKDYRDYMFGKAKDEIKGEISIKVIE